MNLEEFWSEYKGEITVTMVSGLGLTGFFSVVNSIPSYAYSDGFIKSLSMMLVSIILLHVMAIGYKTTLKQERGES